jgi:hypothetical protein
MEPETYTERDVKVRITADHVVLDAGPRNLVWSRETGELVGSGTRLSEPDAEEET